MDASLNPPPRSKKNWRNLIEKMSKFPHLLTEKILIKVKILLDILKQSHHINR